jgi:hypothetical protein
MEKQFNIMNLIKRQVLIKRIIRENQNIESDGT